jgi:hypothetical protein
VHALLLQACAAQCQCPCLLQSLRLKQLVASRKQSEAWKGLLLLLVLALAQLRLAALQQQG